MAILAFQRPDQVIMIQADEFKGIFEFRPLEPGFGITIGNALRRILLSSLEGFAITNIRIEGVEHEFSSIKGVLQDVTDIILMLKKIRFKRLIETETSETVRVTITGQDSFKAGDINNFLTGFQVLNPDLEICRMEPSVKLNMEFVIQHGRGWVEAKENKDINAPVGTIAIDSIHTPIVNVKFLVENYRVEQKTDYEKLIFEIITDGSIHPKEALKEAATILIHHFMLFSDEKITLEPEEKQASDDFDETSNHIRQILKTKMADMNVSVRALNCLKAADIVTLAELVSFNRADLLKFRNFGKKSLIELEQLIRSKGFEFGMKLDRYKLDQETEQDRANEAEKSDKGDAEDGDVDNDGTDSENGQEKLPKHVEENVVKKSKKGRPPKIKPLTMEEALSKKKITAKEKKITAKESKAVIKEKKTSAKEKPAASDKVKKEKTKKVKE